MLAKRTVLCELNIFDYVFLALAIAMVPMVLMQYTLPISQSLQNLFHAYYFFLWFIFLLEFIAKLILAPSKRSYVAQNWIEIVILFFPVLRVFLFIQIFEVGFLILVDKLSNLFSLYHLRSFFKTLILAIIIVAISSELILFFEKPFPESHIKNFADALWWSTVGISTIGVGNVVPISVEGKTLTIFLMISGIILFSLFTANIASLLTEKDVKKDINRELHTIEQDLASIETKMEKQMTNEDKSIKNKLDGIDTRLRTLEKRK